MRESRFHEYCIPDRDVFWRSFNNEHCASYEEVIATLCLDRNRWWCAFCDGPLFIPLNAWWKMWVSKTPQTVWLFHTQIHFTCLVVFSYVTLKGLCVPKLYVMYGLRSNLFGNDCHVLEFINFTETLNKIRCL